jgi:3-hydroxyisobutyrate dehydrogenase/2-hydroxy-3-oxopropionate reductase
MKTPRQAAEVSDAVIVSVAAGPAVRDVVLGVDGVASGQPQAILQTSTIAPSELDELAAALPLSVSLLDCPVLGSISEAAAGRLRILVGTTPALFERWRHPLAEVGEAVWVGDCGDATRLKLVVNAAVAPLVALLAEALALSDRLGLERSVVLDELAETRIGSLVERKRGMIETGDYAPASRLRLFAKDVDIVVEEAERCGLELPVTGATRVLAEEAVAAGLGELDYSVLVHYLETRNA